MSVLTVVTREREAAALAWLGWSVARALEERLVVLCLTAGEDAEVAVLAAGDPLPDSLAPIAAAALADLRPDHPVPPELLPTTTVPVADTTAISPEPLPEPPLEVRVQTASAPLEAVLAQIEATGAHYVVAAQHEQRQRRGASLARKLFAASPAHTLLVRLPRTAEREQTGAEASIPTEPAAATAGPSRILVPVDDGPRARVALRLGAKLARATGGVMTALFVEPVGELADEVGGRLLARALARAGLTPDGRVETRVVLADDRLEAIRRTAAEGYDLVLLGAATAGALRGQLFGTVPGNLSADARDPAVAVIRGRWNLRDRIEARLGRWFDLTVPQLERDDRIRLYEKLESGSRWSFDFMALISLSTAIATLGLLQSSTAVVIGAMLVAPLMTPILGVGLALVQGNLPLLYRAGEAILWGYLMALGIGFVGGALVSLDQLTPELLARGGPTLLDMGVGFFSGVAAAHALSRPDLSAALPGVAIAAALVPPIATTGVSIAQGAGANARGAALLFGTNVVAIILGAALAFYAAGVRGRSGVGPGQRWVRWTMIGLLVGLGVLAVPLVDRMRGAGDEIRALERVLVERLATEEEADLASVVFGLEDRRPLVEVRVRSPAPLSGALADDLARLVAAARPDDPTIRVHTEIAYDRNPVE